MGNKCCNSIQTNEDARSSVNHLEKNQFSKVSAPVLQASEPSAESQGPDPPAPEECNTKATTSQDLSSDFSSAPALQVSEPSAESQDPDPPAPEECNTKATTSQDPSPDVSSAPVLQASELSAESQDPPAPEECNTKATTSQDPSSDATNRRQFVDAMFCEKTSVGNPNISIENVVFLARDDFLKMGRMEVYETCSSRNQHMLSQNLGAKDRVLFVSHRWQRKDYPDNIQNIQYNIIKAFLLSPLGEHFTYIWLDYSCITQARDEISLERFFIQLDNIQTAVFCAHGVLIIPRVVAESPRLFKKRVPPYTDLADYARRGWCTFESSVGMMAGCDIWIAFVYRFESDPFYLPVGDSFPNAPMTLSTLQQHFSNIASTHSFKPVVQDALKRAEAMGAVHNDVRENWERADDPAQVVAKLRSLLCGQLGDVDKKGMISLSLFIGEASWMNGYLGNKIAPLLTEFTADADRQVVVNLLANVGGFLVNGYQNINSKSLAELRELVRKRTEGAQLAFGSSDDLYNRDLTHVLDLFHGESLSLDGMGIGFNGAKILFKHPRTPMLEKISLSACDIGASGCKALVMLLKNPNCSLMDINLSWNALGPKEIEAIVDAPKANQLTCLNLRSNQIGNEGSSKLAESLKQNSSLTSLNLRWNEIGAEGALNLAEALKVNHSLSSLNLCGNQIGDEGAMKLAEALKVNHSLSSLDLRYNQIGNEGASNLAEALKVNHSLSSLNMGLNSLSQEVKDHLRSVWGDRDGTLNL